MSSDPNDRCAAGVCLMALSLCVGLTVVALAAWFEGLLTPEIAGLILMAFVIVNLSVVVWMLCTDNDQPSVGEWKWDPSVEDWKWGMDDSDVMEESEESDG